MSGFQTWCDWRFKSAGFLILLQLAGFPLQAQVGSDLLRGTVSKSGETVSGVPVFLHRVTADAAGVVATERSDTEGDFSFPLTPADSGSFTVYFATAEYQGVRYFGPPIHPGDTLSSYTLAVFDTASVGALGDSIGVAQRDLLLVASADGGWEVDEVLRLENRSGRTLVGPSGLPAWEFRLPTGISSFEVGEGETASGDVQRMGDRLLITAPVRPGARELLLRYRIPPQSSALSLALAQPVSRFNVYLRQPSPEVQVTGLRQSDLVEEGGERFLLYSASDLVPGNEVRVRWSGGPPLSPVVASVGIVLLLLSVGAWKAMRGNAAAVSSSG